MTIGLFIPCYINLYYPKVAIASFGLLRKLGFKVDYPGDQTCCGQPLANSGYEKYTRDAITHFEQLFDPFDIVVAPSASCVLFVKQHAKLKEGAQNRIWELLEFLVTHVDAGRLDCSFPKKVGVLQSCHGLRGLGLGNPSEIISDAESKLLSLLSAVKNLELVRLDRPDECCGFGGMFSVKEPELSVKMGKDRLNDFVRNHAEVITGTDVSCLMHLEGLIKKNKSPLETMHFSEILYQL